MLEVMREIQSHREHIRQGSFVEKLKSIQIALRRYGCNIEATQRKDELGDWITTITLDFPKHNKPKVETLLQLAHLRIPDQTHFRQARIRFLLSVLFLSSELSEKTLHDLFECDEIVIYVGRLSKGFFYTNGSLYLRSSANPS